jgi:hypothetical protein
MILLNSMGDEFMLAGQTGTAAVLYKHANELREGHADQSDEV